LLEGKVNEAAKCFRKMTSEGCKANIITYTTLLNGFCKLGSTTAAVQLLRNMEKHRSCKPDVVAYSTVIDSLCKDGLVADALNLFSEMTTKVIVPNVVTYNSLIHGACLLSQSKEAMRLFHEMVAQQITRGSNFQYLGGYYGKERHQTCCGNI